MSATKQEIVKALEENKYEKDRWGNYQKPLKLHGVPRKVRVKLNDRSVRIELQIDHEATEYSKASKSWVRIGGGYYSECKVFPSANGKCAPTFRLGSTMLGGVAK